MALIFLRTRAGLNLTINLMYIQLGLYKPFTIEKDQTGCTAIVSHVHHRNIRSVENIAVVAQSVEEDPNMSIPYYRRMLSDHFWRETPDYKLEDM